MYFQSSCFLSGKPIFSKSLIDFDLISWIDEFISASNSNAKNDDTIKNDRKIIKKIEAKSLSDFDIDRIAKLIVSQK